ncbi:fasciclin domain-containing protein [Colwellia sp. 12G3]|uniref:fasciclin domain-containing protein n=1 Tax=Colwellia sp. 12G3 TaxID=2058299 RepID=UPI000C323B15|nr:fasciclin domain-containing protein [Colwellia sp. 12G3]PKI14851.1 adhesion lipoprotein [Colwellia sp. 12G3]
MKYFKILSVTILSVVLLQGCNDDDKEVITEVIETVEEVVMPTTIVDVAVADGNFTTLVAALQATGLDDVLADTSATFTVFAPTDAAFALLGQDTINALLADTDTLSDILTYHVISGEVNAEAAISLAGTNVSMVNGDLVGLSLNGDNLLVNTATVITTDIQTDNGIIHVIDAVLLPPEAMMEPTANIVEVALADPDNFSTLVAALTAADLVTTLSNEDATFTVFAPTNAAFSLIAADTLAALLADTDTLTKVLLQHVVPDAAVNSVNAFALSGAMVDTASMAKVALNINMATDTLLFGGANIVMKDIYTTNGIIHVIDAVILGDVELPKPGMSLVEVASGNSDLSTLVSALQSTGLDTVLANLDNDYTVFAPTNAAFAKLPAGTVESLTSDQLSNILLYHVIAGTVLSDGAITLAQSMDNMAVMANESKASVSFSDGMLFINGAKISAANVIADNGVVHLIDNVIMPPGMMAEPTMNIVEVALADPDNFSTLVTALTAADLVTTLSDEDSMFTVFAPTNAAFAKIDADALTALLADTEMLTEVLLTHVIAESSLSALDAYAANGRSLTTASSSMIDVSIDAETGMLMIGGAKVIITDIYTTNGVIHVIDTVILD